jgi:hypothetical protein
LGIDLIPGRHVPEQANTTLCETNYDDFSDTKVSVLAKFDPYHLLISNVSFFFSFIQSFISTQTRFDDSESDITDYTTPSYKTVKSSRSTVRSHQSQQPRQPTQQQPRQPTQQQQRQPPQQQQPTQRAPPGFSNLRDPRNPWNNGEDSGNNEHNSTNPFVTAKNTKKDKNHNATYSGTSGDYPALYDSNPFSRSHMVNEGRAPLGKLIYEIKSSTTIKTTFLLRIVGAGRGMLTPQRGAWGKHQ